jgi:hypothetical protein
MKHCVGLEVSMRKTSIGVVDTFGGPAWACFATWAISSIGSGASSMLAFLVRPKACVRTT